MCYDYKTIYLVTIMKILVYCLYVLHSIEFDVVLSRNLKEFKCYFLKKISYVTDIAQIDTFVNIRVS